MASTGIITGKPKQAARKQPSVGEERWDGQKWLVWTGKNWGKAHTHWDDRKADLRERSGGFEDKLVRCRECGEKQPAYYTPEQHHTPKQEKLLDGMCFGCYAERRHLRGQYRPQSAPIPTILPDQVVHDHTKNQVDRAGESGGRTPQTRRAGRICPFCAFSDKAPIGKTYTTQRLMWKYQEGIMSTEGWRSVDLYMTKAGSQTIPWNRPPEYEEVWRCWPQVRDRRQIKARSFMCPDYRTAWTTENEPKTTKPLILTAAPPIPWKEAMPGEGPYQFGPEIQKKYKKRAEALNLVNIMGLPQEGAAKVLGISRQAVGDRLKALPFGLTYVGEVARAAKEAATVAPEWFTGDWPFRDRFVDHRIMPAPYDVVYARSAGRCPRCGSRVEMDDCGCILCHRCGFAV